MKNWKRRVAAVLALSSLAGFLTATTWNAGFEGAPAGTDLVSDLDTFIQQLKLEVRNRSSVEEIFGTGTDDTGLNRVGSARAFSQTTEPTVITGPGQYNAAATAFDVATLTAEELGASTDDIGRGRLWDDRDGTDAGTTSTLDDHRAMVYDETLNTFTEVRARDLGGAGIGARNLLYNGGFEITDGTGLVASTTAPAGWTNLSTATIAYVDPTAVTEGEGLALRTTAAGGTDEGVRQAILNPKASTTYVFRVRVRATAGDTCNINVADGTTSAADTSATTGVFETLEAQLTTTAVPATVNFDLRSTADTDVCDWDHATVFERYATVLPAGPVASYDSDNTQSDVPVVKATVPNLTANFTPPGPGWVVEVHADLSFSNTGGAPHNAQCNLDNGADLAGTQRGMAITQSGGGTGDSSGNISMSFLQINPTPGTTITYTAECESSNVAIKYNGAPDGVTLASNLWLVAIPPR